MGTEYPDSMPGDETVWVGSLAGFEVAMVNHDQEIAVIHRCGWDQALSGSDHFLGNLIEIALGHRQRTCRGDGF